MELRETCLENKSVHERKKRKGAAEYFGVNLTHILNLVQFTDAQDFLPVWEALARASKHQQLLVLQRAFVERPKRWASVPLPLRRRPCSSWSSPWGSGWRAGTT